MTKRIGAIQLPPGYDHPALSDYRKDGDWYVAEEGDYIDKELLTLLLIAGVEYKTRNVPEQAEWSTAVWGESVWPQPEDFPDYKISKED